MKKSVFEDTEEISRRFTVAVHEALLDHKRAGNPIAIWRDGKVIIIPPEEIAVDPNHSITQTPNPLPGRPDHLCLSQHAVFTDINGLSDGAGLSLSRDLSLIDFCLSPQ